ncbi:MerR family transcriptional regulator [Streptomyces sp. DSM 44917]|uniref:MerR family transcriptional regulator n=1 Tax=Streptomyces boetiae TaxID=3075541 RepID=A0ABU2L2G8_9ACTN|nr:MerR family transcriptional regulator [Streptomyces sp. DSM 44917]MDT0305453.1 MerR family transcriptional regulator [Streptomyces sp. DSM 44917]
MDERELTIGELAGRFGLATHVLRHWEDVGLLQPSRRVGGQRRYDGRHLVDVAMILLGKDSGLSLAQLREMRSSPERAGRHAVLRAHRDALRRRIAAARAQLDLVEHALECEAEDYRACPAFLAKADAYLPPPPADRP